MKTHLSRRAMLRFFGVASLAGGTAGSPLPRDGNCRSSPDHIAWVVDSLERMMTIQPGVSRARLMDVFTTEGGISTALQRTFVSRDCPYFKVNVKFRRATDTRTDHGQEEFLRELDSDIITDISEPFLQFSIMD